MGGLGGLGAEGGEWPGRCFAWLVGCVGLGGGFLAGQGVVLLFTEKKHGGRRGISCLFEGCWELCGGFEGNPDGGVPFVFVFEGIACVLKRHHICW